MASAAGCGKFVALLNISPALAISAEKRETKLSMSVPILWRLHLVSG
jgi:hypothetical protein